MELHYIDQDVLKEIHDLLSLSAGYEVSLNDELEYFEPEIAKTWIVATDVSGRRVGFIRSVPMGTDWSSGELFVHPSCEDRRRVARALLEAFKIRAHFNVGHRLRFDIGMQDFELNIELESCGFSQKKQTFLHFEITATSFSKLDHQNPSEADVHEIVETLKFLNPVTESEVRNWITKDSLRIIKHDSKIASAAQISESNDAIEIVRIATHANHLRKGFASILISQIVQEASNKGKSYVYLKVEDSRLPAISTYKAAGFVENKAKSQLWHSRWY